MHLMLTPGGIQFNICFKHVYKPYLMSTRQMKPITERGLKHTRKHIQSSNMTHLLQFLRIVSILQNLISMKQVQVERLRKFNQAHMQNLRGGNTIEEVIDEQTLTQSNEQVPTKTLVEQEAQQVSTQTQLLFYFQGYNDNTYFSEFVTIKTRNYICHYFILFWFCMHHIR